MIIFFAYGNKVLNPFSGCDGGELIKRTKAIYDGHSESMVYAYDFNGIKCVYFPSVGSKTCTGNRELCIFSKQSIISLSKHYKEYVVKVSPVFLIAKNKFKKTIKVIKQ